MNPGPFRSSREQSHRVPCQDKAGFIWRFFGVMLTSLWLCLGIFSSLGCAVSHGERGTKPAPWAFHR